MKRNLLIAAFLLTGLAACAPPPPIVTAFNGDSVEIMSDKTQIFPNAQTAGEADRICSKAGKHAEYASSRPVDNGNAHLYLCLASVLPAAAATTQAW